jgi:hypothetical protein
MTDARAIFLLMFAAALAGHYGFPSVHTQTTSTGSKHSEKEKSHLVRTTEKIYEDDQFRIAVPSGWTVGNLDRPGERYPTAGPSIPYPGTGLVLTKQGYTLALAHSAGHASPNGRFGEVFRMPWLPDVADEGACGRYLREVAEPVDRKLIFINLVFAIDDSLGLKTCNIRGDEASRWFVGYFATTQGNWFFGSDGADCAEKAYTLTSGATNPTELPNRDDPTLRKIRSEAIDIVASIHYKRCAPANSPDSP